jgi:hypothetical protein
VPDRPAFRRVICELAFDGNLTGVGSPRPGSFPEAVIRPRDPGDEAILSMAMSADDILAHPALGACVRGQAQALVLTHQASPRTASPFATQQRWLIAQAALSLYFRNEATLAGSGVLAERVLDQVVRHDLASRNTAAAFLREMLKYDLVRHVAASEGRRHRPLEPSPMTMAALLHWHMVHLATLDGLDGGARCAALRARPAAMGSMQPRIADGLLASSAIRTPDGTFSLFTWINDGGIVMDRLIAGCRGEADGTDRISTDVTSVSGLALGLKLSRTQLGRKFAAAEAMGSFGWSGARGKSPLWVSAGFRREYHAAQAIKLAIVDAAFEACFAQDGRDDRLREAATSP